MQEGPQVEKCPIAIQFLAFKCYSHLDRMSGMALSNLMTTDLTNIYLFYKRQLIKNTTYSK